MSKVNLSYLHAITSFTSCNDKVGHTSDLIHADIPKFACVSETLLAVDYCQHDGLCNNQYHFSLGSLNDCCVLGMQCIGRALASLDGFQETFEFLGGTPHERVVQQIAVTVIISNMAMLRYI